MTQYYPPENALVPYDIAVGLSALGHSVSVITGFPNYPHGRIFEGYRRRFRHEEWADGIRVRRVPHVVSHSRNPIGRIASYVSFGLSTLAGSSQAYRADVVYVYATQMTAAIAPMYWWSRRGIPYVLHIQDLWPESITGSSMIPGGSFVSRAVEAVLGPWLTRAYRRAAAVVAISPTMKDILVARGTAQRSAHTVLNWALDAPESEEGPRRIAGTTETLNILYAGTVGGMQGLDTVIEAAALLEERSNIRIDVVGDGPALSSLRLLVEKLGVETIRFHGRIPKSQVRPFYERADFQLVTLRDVDIARGTIPSKFQSSMAWGIPILTNIAGDVATLVGANGLGLVAEPGSARDLAMIFEQAGKLSATQRRRMSANCTRVYEQTMQKTYGVGEIARILVDASVRN
ncbi:glycosyltransferase family 4 protein [Leifsonia flava]|uniref:glycosyltransferase family 4 protein n=1 Tax=Orlajensenia leifsoniae TaxID=2561933 RepID=UPI00143025D5|nr:glycosyltransferase family 4 protein [Leifsonia flava]